MGRSALALLPIGGLVALLSLPTLLVPLGRDQGIFAAAGAMVRDGKTLYRDVFEVKQPYVHCTYALAFSVFGERAWAPALTDLLWRLAALVPFWLLGRRLFGAGGGALAAALYGLLSTALYDRFWQFAQAETFAAPLTALGLWLHVSAPGASLRALLCGVAFGAAAGFKATALLPLAAVLGHLLLRRRFLALVLVPAGVAAAWAPFAAHLVARGAVRDFLEVQWEFNRFHAAAGSGALLQKLGLQAWLFLNPATPLSLTLSLVGAGLAVAGRRRELGVIVAWWALAYATVPLQGKFWHYHFLMVLPPHVVLVAHFLREAAGWMQRGPRGAGLVAIGLVSLSAAATVQAYAAGHETAIRRALGRLDQASFLQAYRSDLGDWRAADVDAVARLVRERTRPEERVLVFCLDQAINFLSGRRPPTRFLYDYPLTLEAPGYGPLRERFRAEFLRDLRAAPPRMIVTARGDANPIEPEDSLTALQRFEAFATFVRERYRPAATVGNYVVLERHDG